MKKASITQAKNHLSALLDAVRKGESVLILDRNRPVARLEPVSEKERLVAEGRLADLERSGLLRRPRARLSRQFFRSKLPKAKEGASVLEALLAERHESR